MVKAYLNYSQQNSFSSVVTNTLPKLIHFHYKEKDYILTAGNESVYVLGSSSGSLERIITRNDKKVTVTVTCLQTIDDKILIGYDDGEIIIYDFTTETQENSFSKHENSICLIEIDFQSNLKTIYSASIDKKIYVWDLEICEDIFELKNLTAPASSICFTKKNIFVSSKDGTFRMYDIDDGTL